jgi:hypothetical protein
MIDKEWVNNPRQIKSVDFEDGVEHGKRIALHYLQQAHQHMVDVNKLDEDESVSQDWLDGLEEAQKVIADTLDWS